MIFDCDVCAGFQSVSDVTQFSLDTWQKMLTVHLTAPFLLTQRLLPAMVDRGQCNGEMVFDVLKFIALGESLQGYSYFVIA